MPRSATAKASSTQASPISIKLKPGETYEYQGLIIAREQASPIKKPYRIVRDIMGPDPARYPTFSSAREAANLIIADAQIVQKRDESLKIANARNAEEARIRHNASLGMSEIGSTLQYRGRIVKRIKDAHDGTKRYQVDKMQIAYESLDEAIAAIDWAVKSIKRIEDDGAWDDSEMKKNLEK